MPAVYICADCSFRTIFETDSVITTAITNLWGIIPFALLLPAGILALRFKKRKATTAKKEEGQEESREKALLTAHPSP
jgi:hypothetical protein